MLASSASGELFEELNIEWDTGTCLCLPVKPICNPESIADPESCYRLHPLFPMSLLLPQQSLFLLAWAIH